MSDGPVATRCRSTAMNFTGIARFRPGMVMATVAPFPSWRQSPTGSARKCSSKGEGAHPIAEAAMAGPFCAQALESSWPKSTCTRLAYQPQGR